MKVYEGARGLDGAIVIVDGKPLPPRHGEPTSRRNSPRNRWFESVPLQRGVTNEPRGCWKQRRPIMASLTQTCESRFEPTLAPD